MRWPSGCDPDLWEDAAAEHRAEERARRAYHFALLRHPDQRDPDYPGDDDDDDDDEEDD